MYEVCTLCKFDETLPELGRLIHFLRTKDLDVHRISYIENFNFGSVPKCKYGMVCSKTMKASTNYREMANDASKLLIAYIEQTDCSDSSRVLQLLQGNFPAAYNRLTVLLRRKK